MSRRWLVLVSGVAALLVAGAVAGVVLAGGVGSDSAAGPEAMLEGPNVLNYGQPYELRASERFIVQGKRLPGGGCEFARSSVMRSVSPSTPEVAEIEVAFDPDTCRSLLERGTWADTNESFTGGQVTDGRSGSSSSSAPARGAAD
jgi:hypothetical protein